MKGMLRYMAALHWLELLLLVALLAILPRIAAAELPKNVCTHCHGRLTGRLGEPVKLWRQSIHAENGIACNNCHGGDPNDAVNAMSPARGFLGVPKEKDIPAFCGRCHIGVLKDFTASLHDLALNFGGGPTCVSCHGNHHILKASLDLINEKNCTRCHSFEKPMRIKAAMQGTEARIGNIDGRIAAYKQEGADVARLEKALFPARNSYRSLFHELDVEKVKNGSQRIGDELGKLERALQEMDETRRKRKLAGGIAVAGALLAAGLLHLLRRSYE